MEGLDTGVQNRNYATSTSGPNFKFYKPTISPNRYTCQNLKSIAGNLNDRMERLRAYQEYKNLQLQFEIMPLLEVQMCDATT
jgi:hypothetical protein